ncbi:MAG TPA: TIM barrel protein [Candidatus Dormibacteraeota bacterium]|nr:TIM barrel protein [Candidatus Dormibacteraeota bacterium]
MRTSIATVSLSGTLEEKLRAAAEAGFDGVEVFEDDLIASPLSPERIRSIASELGLRIELYQPFRDGEALPGPLFERSLRRARRTFALMNRLGAHTMLICSNCSAEAVDDDALAAEQLQQLADVAADHGIRIAYEALAWGRHVNDELHAWRIVATADHPALGLCLDSFHVLSRQSDLGAIQRIPGEKIFFVQLADAPRLNVGVLEQSRHHRCFPGEGSLDLTSFVTSVLAAGYQGPLSLEVFNDVFRQADPRRTAIHAMRSLLALQEGLGLRSTPPPAELRGWACVEIKVDDRSAPAAAKLLRGLGFSHAARHRVEPVDLWQQGEIQILLDARGRHPAGRHGPGPWLSTLGLRSADPGRSAQRARALLAPPRPPRSAARMEGSAELVAPDGTAVLLCPADGAGGWIEGFQPLPTAAVPRPDAGLCRIDHVELGQTLERFEETLLFFRSVLGLRMEESHELTAPDGLIRGRSVSNRSGEVRITLTVPLVGGGRMRGGQHLAFACRDIFATARSLRALGAPILPIPGNYYERLAARTELEADLLEAMREHGILYDRDQGGGTLLHLYTTLLGRQLCFEVVQRVGGYDGLGAANVLVRRSAQRTQAARTAR